jgi:hypothetical protein
VKIEIDPMSSLDGQAYPHRSMIKKDEEQSLIHELSPAVTNSRPPPTHPQFWQVQNANDTDTDTLHGALLIPRSMPGSEKRVVDLDIHKLGKRSSGLSSNILPVPEKDTFHGLAASSSSSKSSFTSGDSTKVGGSSSKSHSDMSGPSAWKAKSKEGQPFDESSVKSDTSSRTPARRLSEVETNDLALAASEEVTDLRRRVALLKQENAELSGRHPESFSFENLPAYDECTKV